MPRKFIGRNPAMTGTREGGICPEYKAQENARMAAGDADNGALPGVSSIEERAGITHLEFASNDLLQDICGPHDRHLALFEQALEICVIPRGNRLVMRGDNAARRAACDSLHRLLSDHARGIVITPGMIQAALREARISHAVPAAPDKIAEKHTGPAPRISPAPAARPCSEGVTNTDGKRVRATDMQASGVKHKIRYDGKYDGKKEPILTLQKRTVAPRSMAQRIYLEALDKSELVFGIGPAGTGKTYLAVAFAAQLFLSGKVDRIILSRPAVEAGERIGFLPGDLKEKVDPYLRPLYDALYDVLHTDFVDRRIASGDIEIAPLAFMRGRTLTRAAIILDEAQNATSAQLKMFLTRLGEDSRMVVTGDPTQTDLLRGEESGLVNTLSLLADINEIQIARFSATDIVRHPLVAKIVSAFEAGSAGE